MLTPTEFVSRWKWGGLSQASHSALKDVNIPSNAKEFLVIAGLPVKSFLRLKFTLNTEGLPALPVYIEDDEISEVDQTVRVIGTDSECHVCLDESYDGRVIVIDEYGQIPTRYMNTSVIQLAEYLLIYGTMVERVQSGEFDPNDENDLGIIVDILREEMSASDSIALQDEESWWSLILEQISLGQL